MHNVVVWILIPLQISRELSMDALTPAFLHHLSNIVGSIHRMLQFWSAFHIYGNASFAFGCVSWKSIIPRLQRIINVTTRSATSFAVIFAFQSCESIFHNIVRMLCWLANARILSFRCPYGGLKYNVLERFPIRESISFFVCDNDSSQRSYVGCGLCTLPWDAITAGL